MYVAVGAVGGTEEGRLFSRSGGLIDEPEGLIENVDAALAEQLNT